MAGCACEPIAAHCWTDGSLQETDHRLTCPVASGRKCSGGCAHARRSLACPARGWRPRAASDSVRRRTLFYPATAFVIARFLFGVNLALASAIAVAGWVLLPMAHHARCVVGVRCEPLSDGVRLAQTALPALIVLAVALLGLRVLPTRPKLAKASLVLMPAAIGLWVLFLYAASTFR